MNKLVVIDTETGGIDATNDSILSIGVIIWENKQIIDSCEIFIYEGDEHFHITEEAMVVNKIDIEWLKTNGKSPKEALRELERFLYRHFPKLRFIPIAGWNVAFDVSFLRRLFLLCERNYEYVFSYRAIDLSSVIQFFLLTEDLDPTTAGSKNVFEIFGVTPPHAHSALDDAIATANLLTKLMEE